MGPLRDISDQLQVMLKLVLALSLLSRFVPTLCLLLLYRLLRPRDHTFEFPG